MKKKIIVMGSCFVLVIITSFWKINDLDDVKFVADVSQSQPVNSDTLSEKAEESAQVASNLNAVTKMPVEEKTEKPSSLSASTSSSVSTSTPTPTSPSRPTSSSSSVPSREGLIKIGDSKEIVVAIMGNPTTIDSLYSNVAGHMYHYKVSPFSSSTIFLAYEGNSEKVVGWWNSTGNLKVTAGDKILSAPPIKLGSSKEDVAKAMGTPNYYEPYFNNRSWYFEGSEVSFDSDYKVVGWINKGNLKVSLGAKVASAPPINFDSTVQDIVKAMGTPIKLFKNSVTNRPYAMIYENGVVYLDNHDKVDAWENKGDLKVSLGEKDLNSPGIKIGSSMEETVKAMGTPQRVQHKHTWSYGNSMIFFNNQWKIIRFDDAGNLKIDNTSH